MGWRATVTPISSITCQAVQDFWEIVLPTEIIVRRSSGVPKG
jgi:hypothetical protein